MAELFRFDFSAESFSNPFPPPAGYTQLAGLNAAINNTGSTANSWKAVSTGQCTWIEDTELTGTVYSEVILADSSATSRGPALVTATGNGYLLLCNSTNVRVFTIVGGSLGSLVFTSARTATTGTWRIQTDGSETIEVIGPGTDESFTDATYTSGFHAGVFSRGTNGVVDEWAGGTEDAQTVTPTDTDYTYGDTITISTVGLGTLTTATLTDSESNVFTLTVTNDTTLEIPALVAALDACLYEEVTLTVGDGTDTATALINLNPPAGYTLTTLTSTGGTPSYVDEWATAAEVGDQIIENEARLTLDADGSYSATGDTAFSAVTYVTSKTGGEITQVTYNFNVDGDGKLTATKLTATKLTATKLTASKL
jgi:hypothetical protein